MSKPTPRPIGRAAERFGGRSWWNEETKKGRSVMNERQQSVSAPAFSLEGEYALDAEHRIARRLAERHHLEKAIAYAERQVANAQAAIARHRRELELLGPHWWPGVTK